ncbi:hypothetical protein BDHH15_47290 [Bradyrhizobium diazoefficiens]|uniref:Uncharacterized protein n=1 Tax=Bradyrhizobium diazoefficiens TaxID=1355477 RepID=A0A809YJS3_9BRAD|nr:hypothetical protein H12S4_50610 [Bradyrhizobium diazoefficiens]BCA21514.1 hypothetical protein BDHH15_47290 [Bradyrhizobium diazoefficiens]BCE39683.1 hypothetical protein XF3B_47140 [Bradyrhizobium diazoefficiens]BCF53079.1 hypothetical protein XF17B_47170 [Bradyrhizobium diazoefficiens]
MVLSPTSPLMSAVERIKTASILAPLLVLDVICATLALLATPLIGVTNSLLWVAWIPFLICTAFTLASYVYWSMVAPNRLQTEHYQLAQQRLLLIGDERDPNSAKLINSAPTANNAIDRS